MFDKYFRFNLHINSKATLARKSLSSLYRFRCAGPRTKLHLYKTLIKPLLTYMPLALSQTAYTNKRKLQLIQNKALRWIYNVCWDQYIRTSQLHDRANVLPLNIEWRRLVHKQIDKLGSWHTDWLDRLSHSFRSGRRSGLGNDLFSLDWDGEVDAVF